MNSIYDHVLEIEDAGQELNEKTNALCPHRSQCLDDACLKGAQHLNCVGCPHFFDSDDDQTLLYDLEGCLRLLYTVYKSEKRSYFDLREAEQVLFDRLDWQDLPSLPSNYLSV